MKLYLIGHEERYALEQLQMCLFPEETLERADGPFGAEDGAAVRLTRGTVWLCASVRLYLHGKEARAQGRLPLAQETVQTRRRLLQQTYYRAAVQLLPAPPPWGALAGVRPTKLTSREMLRGATEAEAAKRMETVYFVTADRAALCAKASAATVRAAELAGETDVSVYVGVPFCPTRCAYCSFVSKTAGGPGSLLEPYLEALLREIEVTGALLRASGRTVRTLYVGGGTPTTFSAAQLRRLMTGISAHFDLSRTIEYTVEAGRPDTLDAEKLRTLRELGADRTSINPQTMNDAVLRRVGRRHTAAQTEAAYRLAVDAGFQRINMDLIAGLPGEDFASFAASLDRVLALGPSNITVHTLALKKGADLFGDRTDRTDAETVARMVAHANRTLAAHGYAPYYLYRQKYMTGSFENVGWCRGGDLCLYNIYMMEELHSIVALGGGGISKANLPAGKIVRFPNPKYPDVYLRDFDGVLLKKQELFKEITLPKGACISK